MVKHLRDLMHEETLSVPGTGIDPARLIERGQTVVRRRRQTWGAAAAAVLVVVGLSAFAVGRDGGREPAPVVPPEAPVIDLRDARAAVEGEDYAVVLTKEVADVESNASWIPRGVTEDGLLVMSQARRFNSSDNWLLSFPEGEIQLGDTPEGHELDYLGQDSSGGLVFEGEGSATEMAIHTYRTDPHRWTSDVVDTQFTDFSGTYVTPGFVWGADRLWVAADTESGDTVLWSTTLGASDWRREASVLDFDVSDETLVYSTPDGRLMVRDLASGDEVSVMPEIPRGCGLRELSASDAWVAYVAGCPEGRDETTVLTAGGEPVITVAGRAEQLRTKLTDRFLTLQTAENRGEITYLLDLRTRELLELGKGWVDGCCQATADLAMWSTSPDDTSATYRLARFD